MKEENKLKLKYGTRNPYRVPDNYFEQFTSRIMEQLPEHQIGENEVREPSRWQRLRPFLYMAAMFCLLLTGGKWLQFYTEHQQATETAEQTAQSTEEYNYMDDMINYAMIDEELVYSYLTDTE